MKIPGLDLEFVAFLADWQNKVPLDQVLGDFVQDAGHDRDSDDVGSPVGQWHWPEALS